MGAAGLVSKKSGKAAQSQAFSTTLPLAPLLTIILPESILIQILSEWLLARDLCLLDTAYSSHVHRSNLLKIYQRLKSLDLTDIISSDVFDPPSGSYCAFLDKSYLKLINPLYGFKFVSWLARRGIQQQLHLDLSLEFETFHRPPTEVFLQQEPVLPFVTKLRLSFLQTIPEDILYMMMQQVCPNALVHIRVIDPHQSSFQTLLDISSDPLTDHIASLSFVCPREKNYMVEVSIVPTFDVSTEHGKQLMTSFLQTYGSKVIHMDAIAFSSQAIPMVCNYCPNLVRLPTMVLQRAESLSVGEFFDASWPQLCSLKAMRELHLSVSMTVPPSSDVLESMLRAYTFLEVVNLPKTRSYANLQQCLSDIASVFRHCPNLTQLNTTNSWLRWKKCSDRQAVGPEIHFTLHYLDGLVRNADEVATQQVVSFLLDTLSTSLTLPIKRCVLQKAKISSSPASVLHACYRFLELPSCAHLQELALTHAAALDVSHGAPSVSLPGLQSLVLNWASPSEVLASGMLACLPNVRVLHIELPFETPLPCQELEEILRILPALVELEVNTNGQASCLQPELLDLVKYDRSGRVWQRLEFKMRDRGQADTFSDDLEPFLQAIYLGQLRTKLLLASTTSIYGVSFVKQFVGRGKWVKPNFQWL